MKQPRRREDIIVQSDRSWRGSGPFKLKLRRLRIQLANTPWTVKPKLRSIDSKEGTGESHP